MKNKFFLFILLQYVFAAAVAQNAIVFPTQTSVLGRVDTADLKLTTCSFEKDANAMILNDKGSVMLGLGDTYVLRYRSIKILNENGKDEATVRIPFGNSRNPENFIHLEAQTVNLVNGKIVYSKVDPKLVYSEHTDKTSDAVAFSFPDVQVGSVLEYAWLIARPASVHFPSWYFQNSLPTRYSEYKVSFSTRYHFLSMHKFTSPFAKDTIAETGGHVWALNNIPSAKAEPYMRSVNDDLKNLAIMIDAVTVNGKTTHLYETWQKTGKEIATDKDFYKGMEQRISGEDTLIDHVKTLKTDNEKIAYLFKQVQQNLQWDKQPGWISRDGIKSVWKKKVGSNGEINMVLYHLLRTAGLKAYPMLVSTPENGRITPGFVDLYQINNLVVYIPVDSTRRYVLDASDKFNKFNIIPFDYLNAYGLYLDKDKDKYDLVLLDTKNVARQTVMIDADIEPDAKMHGSTTIYSYGYRRTDRLERYKTDGEKKFMEYLTDNDNNIKISGLKMVNMDNDTLALQQHFDFTNELSASDDYIYFNPNLFTTIRENPFLSEVRNADIDFGYPHSHVIRGRYKIPKGYKIASLPKEGGLVMADKSIRFRRLLQEEDGYINLNYNIDITRTLFLKEEYGSIHQFYKKMFEMLNEPIVLKKV